MSSSQESYNLSKLDIAHNENIFNLTIVSENTDHKDELKHIPETFSVEQMNINKDKYENEKFKKLELQKANFEDKEFSKCIFENCNFTESNLSGTNFYECAFHECNLSFVALEHSTLNDIQFHESKIVGVSFRKCSQSLLSIDFYNCILDHVDFSDTDLKKTTFKDSIIKECFFENTTLTEANFSGSDLQGSIFTNTDLTRANFVGALNIVIDPRNNIIKKATFSREEALGLLDVFDIEIQ